jgi:hypothetical protein
MAAEIAVAEMKADFDIGWNACTKVPHPFEQFAMRLIGMGTASVFWPSLAIISLQRPH